MVSKAGFIHGDFESNHASVHRGIIKSCAAILIERTRYAGTAFGPKIKIVLPLLKKTPFL